MYPKLKIDLNKLDSNATALGKVLRNAGCSMMIVTKSFCAYPDIVQKIVKNEYITYLADSRVQNLKSYGEVSKKKVLLRIPMLSEVEEVVRYADISFNSELKTIRELDREAKQQHKKHAIVLMIDLGDLREGIFYREEEEIFTTVESILKLEQIELFGIGVNLTCYGAIIPKYDNLSNLIEIARKVEEKFSLKLQMITGGNSSSYYLIEEGKLPSGINNLRLGESFILGNDTAYGNKIEGTVDDAVILQAEIVELKEKPSLPIGEIGRDAFGQIPHYEDKGIRKRAILAIGKQDTDLDGMIPLDPELEILGGSSDHLIVDVTDCSTDYQVGDILGFKLEYGALLRAFTGPYVEKSFVDGR